MSIFSTGAKGLRNAAIQSNMMIGNARDQAFNWMTQGYDEAKGALAGNRPIYDDAANRARDALNQGYSGALETTQGSREHYQPFYDTGMGALSAYNDAMGLNGAEGAARSSQAFRSTPGYQAGLNEQLDSVMRTAAARGGLSSGNTTTGMMQRASDYSDRNYQNYMGNLNTGMQQGQFGATGLTRNDQLKAKLMSGKGTALAGLEQDYGNQLAGVNTGLAGLGNDYWNSKAQLLMDTTGQQTQNLQSAATASAQANANRFGSIMGLGSSLLGLGSSWMNGKK